MAKTATLTIGYTIAGDGLSETLTPPVAITNTNAIGPGSDILLSVGYNSIAIPLGATGVLFVPPTSSSVAKTLKGVTGDTGITLTPNVAFYLPLLSSQTAIGILSTGAETVAAYWS